jgi:hypothetical protein
VDGEIAPNAKAAARGGGRGLSLRGSHYAFLVLGCPARFVLLEYIPLTTFCDLSKGRFIMQTGTRKVIDCGEFPSESHCTLKISGTEPEVLKAASEHAVSSHGHKPGPALDTALRSAMHDER